MRTKPVEPIALDQLRRATELVPQAMIAAPVAYFAERAGSEILEDHDDLDTFDGAAFSLDKVPFAVMHYRGFPENTSAIYLPYQIKDVEEITNIIARIVSAFEVPESAVTWQRKDNPEF